MMATLSLDDTIDVTLGPMAARAEARMASGEYESISDLVREGLLALDREDEAVREFVKKRIAAQAANPKPGIPIDEAFRRMNVFIADYKAQRGP